MTTNKFLIKLENSTYDGKVQISESGVEQVSQKLFNDVLEGRTPAMSVVELFKFVEQIGTKVKGMADPTGKYKFVDLVRDEIKRGSDDGKSSNTKYGTKFELAETGTEYDYTACKDAEWDGLNKQSIALKLKMKEREKFLKTIGDKGLTTVNEDTSEVTKLFPPIKTSTSSYKQTLLKD